MGSKGSVATTSTRRLKFITFTKSYKTTTIQHSFFQGKHQQKINKKPKPSTGKITEGARVVISYIKCLSEQYRCTLAKYKVRVFFKGTSTPSNLYLCIQKIQFQMLKNWYNLSLEMSSQQLHSWTHRWNQQVPERKSFRP